MLKFPKIHLLLSFFVCAIPPALVAGAAVTELFIILSCFLFIFFNMRKIGLEYYKEKLFIFFILFCFYLIFGSLSSEHILNSIKSSMFYFRFGLMTVIICYLLNIYPRFKVLFFLSILLTLLVLIFYSYFQIFVLHNIIIENRISGLFGEESVQGSFLLRIIFIFIILYYYNKELLSKSFHYFFYVILILSFILIILSGERSSIFLMLLVFPLMFVFFKVKLKKIFFFFTLILLTFYLTITFYPHSKKRIFFDTYHQFFQVTEDEKKVYIFSEGHQNHFTSALIMFKKHYIKGVGVRNFRMECKKDIYKKVGKYYCTTHPHNTYMQLLSETGFVGFLFVMSFLIFIFRQVYKSLINVYIKKNKMNRSLGFVFISIIVNFFPFVTTGSFFNNWLSTLYFLPIGFLLYELNYKKN